MSKAGIPSYFDRSLSAQIFVSPSKLLGPPCNDSCHGCLCFAMSIPLYCLISASGVYERATRPKYVVLLGHATRNTTIVTTGIKRSLVSSNPSSLPIIMGFLEIQSPHYYGILGKGAVRHTWALSPAHIPHWPK